MPIFITWHLRPLGQPFEYTMLDLSHSLLARNVLILPVFEDFIEPFHSNGCKKPDIGN